MLTHGGKPVSRGLVLIVACLATYGCQDPYSDQAPASGRPVASRPAGSRAVLRQFAARWINWTWHDVRSQQRALAGLAAPPLAGQLRTNGSARLDATLERDRPGSRGRVVIVRLTANGRGLVLTREQKLTDGHPELGGERYRVYLVLTQKVGHAWKVSRWQPQP